MILDRPLDDNFADSTEVLEDIIFAQGFGSNEVNPYDGHLYVLSVLDKQGSNCDDEEPYGDCLNGAVFRIIPETDK